MHTFADTILNGAAIVNALEAATRLEDLADAFAWVAQSIPSDSSQSILEATRNRAVSTRRGIKNDSSDNIELSKGFRIPTCCYRIDIEKKRTLPITIHRWAIHGYSLSIDTLVQLSDC